MLKGYSVSKGIGRGKAAVLHSRMYKIECKYADSALEILRYIDATEKLKARMKNLTGSNDEQQQIIECYIEILDDHIFRKQVCDFIQKFCCNCEYALEYVMNGYIKMLENSDNELIRTRAWDIEDIKLGLIEILGEYPMSVNIENLPKNSVVVAENIAPIFSVSIDKEHIKGIISTKGSKYSHTAIIARSQGIPMVIGVDISNIKDNDSILIDGTEGICYVNLAESGARSILA